jgi:alkaline phosphatase
MKVFFSLLFLISIASHISAQPKAYSVYNAHSHNDYENDTPFYKAYQKGFGSIEADIFPIDGELLVAHNKKDINKENTLTKMYLQPLGKELNKNTNRKVQLLIDIKENYAIALPILIKQLQPLKKFYMNGRLQILISGNRPLPAEYANYPAYIFFDDDLIHPHTPEQWKRVGLVSLQFTVFTKWKGDSTIAREDEDRLRRIINAVHNAGKPIRFWDAPDTEASWQEQKKLGVNFIGTDKIEALCDFLNSH